MEYNDTSVKMVMISPLITIIMSIVYPLIILLSTVGNIIVILIVTRFSAMRTITNFFILNLAVSDLLMSFVATPFTPIVFHMKTWNLPYTLCQLLPITMGSSVYVSTLTSTALAADRYMVIVHPFQTRMTTCICAKIIACVWLVSIIVSLPMGIFMKIEIDSLTNDTACVEVWPNPAFKPVNIFK